nr:Sca4 family protein [Rickettsia honei]
MEETIEASLRLNNKRIVKIKEFRSMIVPDEDTGETFDISLILKYSDGANMPKVDPAFLKIHYGRDGKLNKLSLPNPPIIFHNQWYPALTVCKGELCSLPISSRYYRYLNKKILENNGSIEISHVDPEFTIELLGE